MADIRKSAAIFFISMRQGRIKGVGGITVQTGFLGVSYTAANIIFIEKRRSLPYEPKKLTLFGLSVGPAMFFSRR